jgi:GNAT superfamily N-acetyltransferase
MSGRAIEIFDCQTRQPVSAWLNDELVALDLLDAEILWMPERLKAVSRMLRAGVAEQDLPQHRHWNWWEKADELKLLATGSVGVHCQGQWQGLMMTTTVGHVSRLGADTGKPLVYVKYLESAPWNVEAFTPAPKYGAIGTRLLEAAVRLSIAEGFDGRIGLHALPNPRTERFYQRRGLTGLGPDSLAEDLPYYEFSPAAALGFLNEDTEHA